MSFTNEQKHIVQSTFAQVTDADHLASRFYDRLFEIDPSTRHMFTHDLTEQRKKLMQTIAVVVHGLVKLKQRYPELELHLVGHSTG